MLVRIIYRPSHHRSTALLDATHGGSTATLEMDAAGPGDDNRQPEAASRPRSRSYRTALRFLALLLFRLGLVALIFAAWRIASDLGLPLRFVFPDGLLSHWQVWFATAGLLMGSAGMIARRLQFGKASGARSANRAEAA